DKIETVEGMPDWSCRYAAEGDLSAHLDSDGRADPWPATPCDGTPCGCGYSADERVAMVAAGPSPPALLLTLVGTPAWARGRGRPDCPPDTRGPALPLRSGKEDAFATFAAAVARRYGSVAYAFELWSEPDLL